MAGILMRDRLTIAFCQALVLVGIIVGWQLAANYGWLNSSFMGTPAGVLSNIVEWIQDGSLLKHIGATLYVLLAGFVIGTALGCVLGAWIGLSKAAYDILEPFLIFFNGMPRLILQPFLIVWLGFGFAPKIVLVIAVIFVLVTVNVAAAFKDVDENIVANVKIMGGTKWQLAWNVYLPSLALAIISTSRANIGFAFQAALVAEFVGTTLGLGYLIVRGQNNFDVNAVWGALAVVIILSMIFDFVFVRLSGQATHWMQQKA